MISGCSLFGSKKNDLPEQEFVPAANVKQIQKERPGLPGDRENARHTDEELRGDDG